MEHDLGGGGVTLLLSVFYFFVIQTTLRSLLRAMWEASLNVGGPDVLNDDR